MKYKFLNESELNRYEKDCHSENIKRGQKQARGKTGALIYCRVATSAMADIDVSINAQEKLCTQFIKDRGYNLVDSYTDIGKSGYRIQGREALNNMLTQSKRKGLGIKVIVATDMDRISRSYSDFCLIDEQLRKAGIKIEFVNGFIERIKN